jgi:hypothetical protein
LRLTDSPTELTTAATDAALAVVAGAIVLWLLGARPSWERGVWMWLFALMAFASILGTLVHGVEMNERLRSVLWQPLYLSLGMVVALFAVAAVHGSSGEAVARRVLPWMLAVAAAFYLLTVVLRGAFLIFILFEGVTMIAAFVVYVWLAARGGPGTLWTSAGIAVSIVAAIVQATSLRARIVVPFDHNGLFHLIQIAANVLLAVGVRQGLAAGR